MRGRGGGGGGRGRGGPYRREVSALGAGGAAGRRPRHVGAVVRRPVAPAHDAEGANHGLAPGHACGVQGEREITGHTSQRTHTHRQRTHAVREPWALPRDPTAGFKRVTFYECVKNLIHFKCF